MEWKTRVTELLGCQYPIMEGAFGGFGDWRLCAAVSEAGAFGNITASVCGTPERLREDIRRCRQATSKPFGVNLTVGMCPHIDEMREVCIEEGIPVVETAAYRAEEHGKRLKEAGVTWIHKVATVKHALAAERQGADAVVIVGLEGIGFKNINQLPTLTSITWAARLLKVPILAAGGIGDARGFLAALAMGAEGVYMGTAFMGTKECPISERYKENMVRTDPDDRRLRERVLAPPRAEEFERIVKMRGDLPLEQWLPRLERVLLKESTEGVTEFWLEDVDEILRTTGFSLAVAVMDRVVTVKELIDSIIRGAEEIIAGWQFLK